MYQVEKYYEKSEWLEKGRGIGGTSASKIIGANPYSNAITLWGEIIANTPKKDITNEVIQYGIENEDRIRNEFREAFKDTYEVFSPEAPYTVYKRTDKTYMTATLDGTLIEKESGRNGILEIKTHLLRDKKDLHEWEKRLPMNYFVQCLHYLLVKDDCDFVILKAELRWFFEKEHNPIVKYYRIEKKEVIEQLKYLEERETDFWENNVVKGLPPALVLKCELKIKGVYELCLN